MTLFGEPISGETPIDDVSGWKISGLTTRAELNVFEAANIEKAAAKYLTIRPSRRSAKFTYDWCLKLHQQMLGDVWDWAGMPRTRDLNLGIPFYAITENLALLLEDLKSWHHRAVQIHPFLNVNGRWSRLLANIWLKHHRQPLTLWPEKTIGNSSEVREQYLAAIAQADAGEYGPLIAMHRKFSAPTS